jgi:hypothetical protein
MDERCNAREEMMPELLNGTLSSEETVDALNHVRACTRCKQELAFLATTKQAAVTAWHHCPSPAFAEELWSRMQVEQRNEVYVSEFYVNRLADTFASLHRAVFPLSPAYQGVRQVYRTVVSQLKHAFLKIIPRLAIGSK